MTVTIPYVRGNSETITGILQPNSIVCYTQTHDHFTTTAYKLMSKTKTAQRADWEESKKLNVRIHSTNYYQNLT